MFDIIIIIICVVGLLVGYQKGFMSQIGSVIGIVLGIIVCQVFADNLVDMFTSPSDTANTRMLHQVLAYVVLFVACFLAGRVVASVGRRTTHALHLSLPDRIAGAAFSILEYLLIFSIFLNIWIAIFPDTEIRSSRRGMTEFTVNFAPNILGSETAADIFEATEDIKKELVDLRGRDMDESNVQAAQDEQSIR